MINDLFKTTSVSPTQKPKTALGVSVSEAQFLGPPYQQFVVLDATTCPLRVAYLDCAYEAFDGSLPHEQHSNSHRTA